MRAFFLLSSLLSLSLLTGCPGLAVGDTADTSDTASVEADGPSSAGFGHNGATDTSATDDDWLVELTDPCQGEGTPNALLFTSSNKGWLGCGNGLGLWRTSDGGGSWTKGHPSADLYVFDLKGTEDGGLLVCGHDYEAAADEALLYRYDGSDWSALLHYGSNDSDPGAAYLSNCGQVASAGDGTLIVASNTSPDLSFSADDGLTWSAADRYWEDTNLTTDEPTAYSALQLTSADGLYFGAGSTINTPPVFYGPSTEADDDFTRFHAWTVDEGVVGEVWALATPDEGATWFAGGRDEGASRRASGFLYRSDDGGQSWSGLPLPDGADTVRDLAFASDGLHGVAVGVRYPVSDGGYVLLTEDGGTTWTLREESVPALESAAATDERFWVAGDAFVARGSF